MQKWRAQCYIAGAKRELKVKPQDHSEEELEKSFQLAVAWRKEQKLSKGARSGAKSSWHFDIVTESVAG